MRGHIRHRGEERAGSWEFIADTGMAAAQRCQACGRRFWLERKPRESCPKCGGELSETEERRRVTKAGFRTQKECAAAMNKILTAVEEKSFTAPTRITVKEFLTKEWLPAIRSTIRSSTYNAYVQHVNFHIVPHIGSLQLVNLSGARINALYATLAETGKKDGKKGLAPRSVHHVHAVLHKACKDAVRWGRLQRSPVDAADPPRISANGRSEMKTWSAEQLGAFLISVKDDSLHPLWHTLAMTGMRRGEAIGLLWKTSISRTRASRCAGRSFPADARSLSVNLRRPRPALGRPGP